MWVLPNWKVFLLSFITLVSATALLSEDDNSETTDNVGKLPHCVDEQDVGYVLVSTLDGKLTALRADGQLAWVLDTDSGPLLQSSIHNVELTNNGEWVRIIPSLSGSLYKFNGKTIDAIPINADTLLRSSFLYSSDIVIAGGKDVRTYGIVAKTGTPLYECSAEGCRNMTQATDEELDDIIVIERSTTTVRAHEPRTGTERWNFSVGHHNIKIPPASCINLDEAISALNITAALPDGVLSASRKHTLEPLWRYVFGAPIVSVWKWDGRDLFAVDLFAQPHEYALVLNPAIYLGMHNKQLYIHESLRMLNALRGNGGGAALSEMTRFPWKPIPAGQLQEEADDSTALSVLYSSNYIDGNGYYFYTEVDVKESNTIFCEEPNGTARTKYYGFEAISIVKTALLTIGLVVATALLSQCACFKAVAMEESKEQQEEEVVSYSTANTNLSTPSVYNDALQQRPLQSHFMDHFDIISQLGAGGYGIVFEVQQKIDKANYAVKIIPLPQRYAAKERVLREVRALAKLDHPNIVRYSTSWDEECLPDLSHLKHIAPFADVSVFGSDIYEEEPSSSSSSSSSSSAQQISIEEEDSFIVFESETQSNSNTTRVTLSSGSNSSKESNQSRRRKYSEHRRYLFIQMQLCDRMTLKDWMRTNACREPSTIYAIYAQILHAVAYIHSMQLIHRDLKPSNIFFNPNTTPAQIKVGDFGLVTPMQEGSSASTALSSASTGGHTRDAGTALYMSPEQKYGSNYNYKVDVFSLGVILFELLIFFATEGERIDVLQQLRRGCFPAQFPTAYDKQHKLLKKMLASRAADRPTVADVLKQIEAFTLG